MTTKSDDGGGVKLAYSYRRFSSKQQSDGTSLERQMELAQDVCKAQGWRFVDLPPDEGVSAFRVAADGEQAANVHKGHLGAFLKRVESGDIKRGSVLIVERLDRFSRNYFDVVFPKWLALLQSGVEIYSCVSNTHYSLASIRKNPMLAGMALIEMANANEYSSGMSKRISRAHSIRIAECAKGKKMNLGPWQPGWITWEGKKGEAGRITLNEHAATVQRVVREYVSGMSMFKIAAGLIRDKVPLMRRGMWSQGVVRYLLEHKSLTGDKVVKGVTLKGFYPALISVAEHRRLQAMLADNRNRRGGSPLTDHVANLFRNRCKCHHCGATMTSHGDMYACAQHRVGGCSAKGRPSIAALEEDFFMFYLKEHPETLLGKHTVKANGTVAALKARIADLDKQLDKATDLLNKLPLAALEKKFTALSKEREAVGRELEEHNLKIMCSTAAPTAFENIKTVLGNFARVGKQYAGTKQEAALVKTIKALRVQLANNETRKKLLGLLPSLVQSIVIDGTAKRYQVINHAGETSGWRQLPR